MYVNVSWYVYLQKGVGYSCPLLLDPALLCSCGLAEHVCLGLDKSTGGGGMK